MVSTVAIILHAGGFPIIVVWNDLEPVALKRSDEGHHPVGVSLLQENNLATCLEAGMKGNMPPRSRQSKVAKTAEWRALDKPWKSLLLIGLNEIQIPEEDESGPSPMMRARRSARTRRGTRGASSPMEWLPKADEVLIDDGSPAAYRLAVLLVRKTLFSDDWDDSWEEIL